MQHYPLVTIVGGSGFVGRHAVKAFANAGYRVRVLVRDTVAAEFLKTTATVGQIAIEHVDISRPETVKGKLNGSDVVVNLVSILYQSGRQKFDAINVRGAHAVAHEAKRIGVKTLIHVSALGVDRMQDTRYGRTKFEGETIVRKAFPEAVILRPSLIVGPEDGFFQRFARMSLVSPLLPLLAGGGTKFQPVLVTDVAAAMVAAASLADAVGQTYTLAGERMYSFRALLEMMARITNRHPRLLPVPAILALAQAFFMELLPVAPPFTRDQVRMLRHDNVLQGDEQTMVRLGVIPAPFEEQLPQYLARFIKQ